MDIKAMLKEKLGLTEADFVKPLPKPTDWSRPMRP